MAELWARFGQSPVIRLIRFKKSIEGDLTENYDNLQLRLQQRQFLNQIAAAALKLDQARLIGRRRTANRGRNKTILKFLTIHAIIRVGVECKSRAMKCCIQPITATIAGKHSPGAIAAVSGRCQPDDQQPRLTVAECCKRFGPIVLAHESARRINRTGFAPANQPWTSAATDNRNVKFIQGIPQVTWLAQRVIEGKARLRRLKLATRDNFIGRS